MLLLTWLQDARRHLTHLLLLITAKDRLYKHVHPFQVWRGPLNGQGVGLFWLC